MLRRPLVSLVVVLAALGAGPRADGTPPAGAPATAAGTAGAVATVDAAATAAGLRILDAGGNAIDAAVAAAAVLAVTEPFSCGLGGGGFLVAWLADDEKAVTLDHREIAPAALDADAFVDPETGRPYPFDERVTSGLAVGVPGTVAGWGTALRRWGTMTLGEVLAPAIRIARRGFVVDQTYHDQVVDNRDRFADFTSTRRLFLPAGEPPGVGERVENPDLARTLTAIAERGPRAFYRGPVAADLVDAVTDPPLVEGADRRVLRGRMTTRDVAGYRTVGRRPLRVRYRGYDVVGMAPPSSGATTVGEALNILEAFDLAAVDRAEALHLVLEASRLAYADRDAYVGDPAFADVPTEGLVSDGFAAERRAGIGARPAESPVAAGDPYRHEGRTAPDRGGRPASESGRQGGSTTHLTVADRHGNVVSYTYTIERIGGSGIVVPGRGFLLNNELTDFEPLAPHPNAPDGRKRPRSSMTPTIVLRDGKPVLAVGSPGGATIITTVLQILVDVLDRGRSLPEALAAPRASQRNTTRTQAEPAFVESPEGGALAGRGHRFEATREIGAATGIAFLPGGRMQAAAEPVRRGGGTAGAQ